CGTGKGGMREWASNSWEPITKRPAIRYTHLLPFCRAGRRFRCRRIGLAVTEPILTGCVRRPNGAGSDVITILRDRHAPHLGLTLQPPRGGAGSSKIARISGPVMIFSQGPGGGWVRGNAYVAEPGFCVYESMP